MSTEQELCGLFGKIPQQSDFVSHHLPESFIEYWHKWLQSSMSISHEQLGEDWLQRYIISPIWHFAIMPNVAHEKAILGVVIPSVDEVGRYFPLTIAHTGDHDIWSAYLHGDEWYNTAEKVALMTLADETTYSNLIGELESLPIPEFEALPAYTTQASMHVFKGNQLFSQTEKSKNDLVLSLLPKAYQQRFGNHSLWWTKGSETVDSCLAISTNLPDPGQFAAMLDGDWQKWGWSEEMIIDNKEMEVA
ncbi:MAG: type VI secretion system-associated protein TagF [Cellvibrionaceae bacterium]